MSLPRKGEHLTVTLADGQQMNCVVTARTENKTTGVVTLSLMEDTPPTSPSPPEAP